MAARDNNINQQQPAHDTLTGSDDVSVASAQSVANLEPGQHTPSLALSEAETVHMPTPHELSHEVSEAETIRMPAPLPGSAADIAASAASASPEGTKASRMVAHDERIPPFRLSSAHRVRRIRADAMGALVATALLILLPAVLAATLWPALGVMSPFGGPPDRIPQGASAWADARTVTHLAGANAAFGAQTYPVDTQFAAAYAARNGQRTLGAALTPGFTSNLGFVQFFMNGALLRSSDAQVSASAASPGANSLDPELADAGVMDAKTGTELLPLSHALLAAGSLAPIGGDTSNVNYVTLRSAAQVADLDVLPSATATPKAGVSLPQVIQQADGVFILEGRRAGKLVGHQIPAALWAYIQQASVSPHGWRNDIGEPVTEPIPVTATSGGQEHHLLAQVFWQTIILTDQDQPGQFALQPVGLDYLRSLGGPTAHPTAGKRLWTTTDGSLRSAAGSGNQAVSLNANAAVVLTGGARWADGVLWYAVAWNSPSRKGTAWVDASTLTATRPTAPLMAGFDTLSTDLASYLNSQGNNVGVTVYDMSRNIVYTYNSSTIFTMASSAKVPLMVSYLTYIEGQGRSPNAYELSVLQQTIENSNNDTAQVIYDTIGDDSGQQQYMQSWGITDYTPDPNGWGWGQWSPNDMVHLLTLLQTGKVLNASDRALAFNLMENIESDQRFGVGDTAPANSTVAMKDGWVNGPDGSWAVNSSGIVTVGGETYIIAVYSDELDSFGTGQDIVNHVARAVAQSLK